MRRVLFLIILIGCVGKTTIAQWWVDAGLPVQIANGVTEIYSDTSTGMMYCTGALQHNMWTPEQAFHYCTYQNGSWTISSPFDLIVWTAIIYHDTLIVGGFFSTIEGDTIRSIACQVNGQWLPYGEMDGAVRRLRMIDGELYAVGDFIRADNAVCNGVAKRVGNSWVNVGEVPDMEAQVQDIALYNDELYIVGALHYYELGAHGIARFNGQEWEAAGTGILGGFAVGLCLDVYQGELYMGGLIDISAGNPGHALMRWNGTEWRSVGAGVQGLNGGYEYLYTVNDLEVHNGLLYASGGFNFAGNAPAEYIATWDGERWCGLGGTFSELGPIYSHGFYGDTLFVGCYDMADGQPVNSLARYIGTGPDTCSAAWQVGMPETLLTRPVLVDMGNGVFRFSGGPAGGDLRVYTAAGQLRRKLRVVPEASGSQPFSLADLPAGIYILDLNGSRREKLSVVH